MLINDLFKKLKVNDSQKIISISIIIGICSGLMGVCLKYSVHYIFSFINEFFNKNYLFIFPIIGVLTSYLIINIIFKNKIQVGLTGVLYAIARKAGIISKLSIWIQPITSILTIGFGGSAGIEGPIVATSSAIGSNISEKFKLNYQDRILMISAGTAAGIASVFNAPIAGVMFAIEILLPNLNVKNFIPLMISGASGALCSKIILNENILLNFTLTESFNYLNVPWYILLGIICGIISLHYIRITQLIDLSIEKIENKIVKLLIGIIFLSILFFIFPPLLSEGSSVLKNLAMGNAIGIVNEIQFLKIEGNYGILIILILLLFLKPVTVALTIHSGGNGGNFGPSLLMGALVGYAFSLALQNFTGSKIPLGNFSLVGMAGVLSGVMHSPLTAIFLIAEITGGYELFIPLLIVSSFSYLLTKQFEPYSIDTKKLAYQKNILTHDKDSNALLLMDLSKLIERDIFEVYLEDDVKSLIQVIKKSHRNFFAVIDENKKYLGIVFFDDLKNIIFETDIMKSMKVSNIYKKTIEYLDINDSMSTVVDKFERTSYWNLPVTDNGKYIGFVSKSRIFDEYRRLIKNN